MSIANLVPGSAGTLSVFGGTGGSLATGGGGTFGPIYTTASAWSNPTAGTIQVKGDAVFEGNITWQDRDMRAWFESVESRLAILQPNTQLEAEYEELAELSRQYRELEKRLLEKQQTFDILKNP
jgi:hypothetical protein